MTFACTARLENCTHPYGCLTYTLHFPKGSSSCFDSITFDLKKGQDLGSKVELYANNNPDVMVTFTHRVPPPHTGDLEQRVIKVSNVPLQVALNTLQQVPFKL